MEYPSVPTAGTRKGKHLANEVLLSESVLTQLDDGTWHASLPWLYDLLVTSPSREDLPREILRAAMERCQGDEEAKRQLIAFVEKHGEDIEEEEPPDPVGLRAIQELRSLKSDDFDEKLAGHDRVLVDFWAPWCRPCLAMAPTLLEFAEEVGDKLPIYKVNNDESLDLAERFGVRSIPTLILFEKGQEKLRLVGARNKAVLKKDLEAFLT